MSLDEQAGEERSLGATRIVLQVRTSHPSEHALDAAMRIARAFRSQIEGLYVEDGDLMSLASLPFAREFSFMGRGARALSPEIVERDMRLASAAIRRRIESMARIANVPLHFNIVQDEPARAVASVCASCGEASLVALADPFAAAHADQLRRLMAEISGLAGVVLVGPAARRSSGPVIAAVESRAGLEPTLAAARQLAEEMDERLVVLVIDGGGLGSEAKSRAGSGAQVQIMTAESVRGEPAVVAEAVRRLQGGFVVARLGGTLVPGEGSLAHLVQALECPLLLLR
jgi:hypothetical protein